MPAHRATAVPNPANPKRDLRVIVSPDGRILSDRRNQQPKSTITTPKPLTSPSAPSSYQQHPQKSSAVPKPRRFENRPKR